MDLVLQRFQHVGPVLEFHFALQQHELRDFLQSRTLWGLRGVRDRCTRRTLFGQRATCFPVGRRQVRKFARTVQPTLDKTENSIAGLGPNVQRNRNTGNTVNPQGIRHGPHRESSAVPVKCAPSKIHSIPKTFKHPEKNRYTDAVRPQYLRMRLRILLASFSISSVFFKSLRERTCSPFSRPILRRSEEHTSEL